MVELINTSAELLQIGTNVKLGEGEPLESHGKENENTDDNIGSNESPDFCRDKTRNRSIYSDEVNTGSVNRVSSGGDASSPGALGDVLEGKLTHLTSVERAVLIPVIAEYCDLFRYDRSGMLPCTNKGFHEIKTGDAMPIKKTLIKCRLLSRTKCENSWTTFYREASLPLPVQSGQHP
jgi:hypothetical protein